MGKYHGIVWTQKTKNNTYVCAACITSPDELPKLIPVKYEIPSTVLLPFYMNINLVPYTKLRKNVKSIYSTFEEKAVGNESVTKITVGYDYGFLLSALNKLSFPESKRLFVETLSVVDDSGAWSEYYINGEPAGTRCRPWESGINIEALIEYAQKASE